MAIKKSDLYSSLWASCDELRGGMDASQYKDYVLFMLFIKYISDKYGDSDDFAPPVTIPVGSSFKDMIQLKGKSDVGEKINTQIIQPLIEANSRLARSDFPDFDDPNKLGEGSAKVERLTNLIGIFQKPELDFSKNRAENDDILGDAYEYLMRHFATESGKSKGQFYTPSEVSRIIAKVIGISPQNAIAATTAYDPTCGSGSLLLKVAAEAGTYITLEGQEKDVTTAGLARMNMILHDFPTANILSGNTLAAPKFKDGEQLRTYDYVVANPPFSDKTWSTGLTLAADPFQRFKWGEVAVEPPGKPWVFRLALGSARTFSARVWACTWLECWTATAVAPPPMTMTAAAAGWSSSRTTRSASRRRSRWWPRLRAPARSSSVSSQAPSRAASRSMSKAPSSSRSSSSGLTTCTT